MSIELSADEKNLADHLRTLAQKLSENPTDDDKRAAYSRNLDEAGKKGLALHKMLAARGHEPVHTRFMIQNREKQPTDPGFYANLHAVEDLLAFIAR